MDATSPANRELLSAFEFDENGGGAEWNTCVGAHLQKRILQSISYELIWAPSLNMHHSHPVLGRRKEHPEFGGPEKAMAAPETRARISFGRAVKH